MNRFLRFALLLASFWISGAARAATITFTFTNSLGVADTNYVIIYPISSPVRADGGYHITGVPAKVRPNSQGVGSVTLLAGNYVATNAFLGTGILFDSDNTLNSYSIYEREISGGNVFVTRLVNTNSQTIASNVLQIAAGAGMLVESNSLLRTVKVDTNVMATVEKVTAEMESLSNAIPSITVSNAATAANATNLNGLPAAAYVASTNANIHSGTNDAITSLKLKRYDLKDSFGAVGDGQIANDSRIASGSTSLFCSTVSFTSADVGKVFTLYRSNLVNLTTTIASVVNSTNITLADAPDIGVTNFPGVFGTDDTAAIQRSVDFTATNGGGRIIVPKGIYIIAGPLRDTEGDGITNHNAQIYAPNIAHIGQQCPIILFEGVAEQGGRVSQDFKFENYGSTFWSTLAAGPDGTNYGNVFDFRSPDSGSKPGIITPAFTVHFNNIGVATKNMHFRAAWDNGMALCNLGGTVMANLQDTTFDGGWDWSVASYYPAFMPTRTNTIGVIFPQVFNDNRVYGDNVVASCFYRNICLGENLKSKYIASYYGDIGFDFYNAGGAPMELSYFHTAECKTNFYHSGGFTAQVKMYGFIQQQIVTNFNPWYDPFGAITGEGFFILGNSSGTISKFTPATFSGSPNFDATCLYSISGTSTGPRHESVQRFGTHIVVEGNAFCGGELDITNSPGVYSMKLTRTANQAAVLAQMATDSTGGWNLRKEVKSGSAMYSDSFKLYWGGPFGTFTSWETATNGVMAFPNGVQSGIDIANPAPLKMLYGAALSTSTYKAPSGTDVLLWNSNKVIYAVSSTKTNLISDLR